MSSWIVVVVCVTSFLFGMGLYELVSSRYSVFKKLGKNLLVSIVITLVLLLIVHSPILFRFVPSLKNIHITALMFFSLGFLPRLSLLQRLEEAPKKRIKGKR